MHFDRGKLSFHSMGKYFYAQPAAGTVLLTRRQSFVMHAGTHEWQTSRAAQELVNELLTFIRSARDKVSWYTFARPKRRTSVGLARPLSMEAAQNAPGVADTTTGVIT